MFVRIDTQPANLDGGISSWPAQWGVPHAMIRITGK